MSNGASRKTFKFNAVFGPQADQGEDESMPSILSHVLKLKTCSHIDDIYCFFFFSLWMIFLRIQHHLQPQF